MGPDAPSLLTRVVFGSDARKQLYKGLEVASNCVGSTLGPRGRLVLVQRDGKSPMVTKDGVSVARSIHLKDPIQHMGAQLVLEAASHTNDAAGDGTTTATVLTQALVREGLKLLEGGFSALHLCRGINVATDAVMSALRESAVQLRTSKEIAQVGTVSANGDDKIGDLIAQAMEKVGHDGIITVEDAKGMTTSLDVVEGARFDRGYLSPYFVTNNDHMQAVYANALILVTDRKLTTLREILHILEQVSRVQRPLLIIADDVEGEALHSLVLNRVQANLQVVAIKAPGYGNGRDDLLRDICVMTKTRLVSSSTGVSLDKLKVEDLGQCRKLVVDAKTTTMVGLVSKEAPEMVSHLDDLRMQLQDVTLGLDDVNWLRSRIARLASGVAVIHVGGATEIEMVEKRFRVEDALNATRSATEEGIIPGGGTALFNAVNDCRGDLMSPANTTTITDDELMGRELVLKACLEPLRRIVKNAGMSDEVVINELRKNRAVMASEQAAVRNWGYNAATGTYEDLVKAGVIDPVKVCRTALKNAASVAVTFLGLDAVICEEEKQ